MSKITHNKLSHLDRIKISLEVLDGLKDRASKLPSCGRELHELGLTFKHVRHGLELEIRHLVEYLENNDKYIKMLESELGKLRSEIGAGDSELETVIQEAT